MTAEVRCELCDLPRTQCEHGRTAQQAARAGTARVLISPQGLAHFDGCRHKGDDPDMSRWGELETPGAWIRLGNGEQLPATGGDRPDRVATRRCADCVDHGPW
ncbi:hypothetical protein GCM10011594_40150 [Nakamurella endophytica]|uniref:Uncharacterized protein n=1 Tax=Nakamurella endophytica TaxID=1748367 RepID=A0A917TA43_9ACTN|nr:hypothetical protein GCM10011594_40150 [Nakamurella endophytica]